MLRHVEVREQFLRSLGVTHPGRIFALQSAQKGAREQGFRQHAFVIRGGRHHHRLVEVRQGVRIVAGRLEGLAAAGQYARAQSLTSHCRQQQVGRFDLQLGSARIPLRVVIAQQESRPHFQVGVRGPANELQSTLCVLLADFGIGAHGAGGVLYEDGGGILLACARGRAQHHAQQPCGHPTKCSHDSS